MKNPFIYLLFIFLGLQVNGQVNKYGIPIIKNYSAEVIHGSDYTHSIIKDKLGNIYFANEDMGIIRYDGNNWRTIPVRNNQLIRALGIDKQGTIYAGGKYEFGYLEPDKNGRMTYKSLSQRFDEPLIEQENASDFSRTDAVKQKIYIGEILSLVVKDSDVYFVSNKSFFDYNIITDSLTYINLADFDLKNVLKIFLVNGRVILGDNANGLCEFKNGKIEMLPGGPFFNGKQCLMIMPYDENRALVATYKEGLFLYNYLTGEVLSDFAEPALQKLLGELRIYTGTALPSGEYAIGTIQGGIFVIDHAGKLIRNWDQDNSGLMNNSVLAFYCDTSANSELWISTIRFISKVYLNLPFTEISSKSGIDGGVDCIAEMGERTYISTDLGVYKSNTNKNGRLEFLKIPEIIDQVFPLLHARVDNNEFILAGSLNGLFQISPEAKVTRVIDNTPGISAKEKILDLNVRIIVQSKLNPNRFYIGKNSDGIVVLDYKSGKWTSQKIYRAGQGSVSGIVEVDNGDLIFATDYSNNIFHVSDKDSVPVLYSTDKGIPEASIASLGTFNNEIVLVTAKGLYKYIKNSDSWLPYNEITGGFSEGRESHLIMQDQDGDLWYAYKDSKYSEMLFKRTDEKINIFYGPLALLPNAKMIDIKNFDNKIMIAKSNSVFVIEKDKLLSEFPKVTPLFSKIIVGRDSVLMDESFIMKGALGKSVPAPSRTGQKIPELKYYLNSVSFFWATPYFINEESTTYSFRLEGFDSEWSAWEKVFYKDYTNLPYGHYHFRVKAKTATDILSDEAVYEFIILKPWFLTAVMLVIYVISLIFIIFAIIKAYTKKLKNENLRLEGIVAERTAVVVKQKDELESSIHYASRIQMALLPSVAILSENIKNYFVLLKPRDIVSGDFYWMTKKGGRLYIVAADCTGHGVPGAFMSLLGMSFLDEIIDKELAPRADFILKELRLHVTESLKQVGGDDEAKDGMDIALLVIDFNTQTIEFSGAYNPCFRVRKLSDTEVENYRVNSEELADGSMSNGKYLLDTIYSSKMPIGISSRMNEEFVFHSWELEKGVSYYMFSDGYIDQFGGPKGRKFMKKAFKRLILEIQDFPMSRQKELLDKNLKEWMGQSPQIDDILVMGIRTD